MAENNAWKIIVWERLNKTGKWCPYSAEVSQLLEQSYRKELDDVSLGDAVENMKIYTVNFKDMVQISSATGTKSSVRRKMCESQSMLCNGFTWQWGSDHDTWNSYEVEVNNYIEEAYSKELKSVTLKKAFRGYNYEIDFKKMVQINKQTKRKRPIRRIQNVSPYPVTSCVDNDANNSNENEPNCTNDSTGATSPVKDSDYSDLGKEIPGTDALLQQVNQYIRNVKRTYIADDSNDVAVLNDADETVGTNCDDTLSCDTNQNAHGNSSNNSAKCNTIVKLEIISETEVETGTGDVLKEYTSEVDASSSNVKDEDCIICCEPLTGGSSYDGDTTVVQLKQCPHVFHKSCLLAMYNNGPRDNCLQCPVCKTIHGVKYGIQPSGNMIYHVLPYSLPSYPECDTIRIIYDIPSGTQGPEHPMPGRKYTARGFPRHCYLPDNDMGRKVLRLLVKAWKRRLIFTIGRSSTTGEENTVTWNEIHHKTEFGCNRRGHGFPDPNYFSNVLSELEAHGVKDDDVYLWYPA